MQSPNTEGEQKRCCSESSQAVPVRLSGKSLRQGTALTSLYIKIQLVPLSKHFLSVIQTSPLMLYREIMAVCSEIHTKHVNTVVWAERRVVEC